MNIDLSKEEIRKIYFALESQREVLQMTLSNSRNDNPILLRQEIEDIDTLVNKLMQGV